MYVCMRQRETKVKYIEICAARLAAYFVTMLSQSAFVEVKNFSYATERD